MLVCDAKNIASQVSVLSSAPFRDLAINNQQQYITNRVPKIGFLKKTKKNKDGGGGGDGGTSSRRSRSFSRTRSRTRSRSFSRGRSFSRSRSSRPAPQDSSTLGSTLGTNGSSFLGSTNGTASAAAAEEERDSRRYRGKNPHRRMNKEHAHHHPSSSGGAAAAAGAAAADHPNPTLALVPGLVRDLETAPTASGDVPARALRTLFSLSEHGGGGGGGSTIHGSNGGSGGGNKTPSESENNRTAMVRQDGGRLVPVLLGFLRRCERGSSEQYLALLVLNNISIPSDNKRVSSVLDLHLYFAWMGKGLSYKGLQCQLIMALCSIAHHHCIS